ncbi:MAG TPA: porin [Pseudomonas sp.]|jgi:predicted porin|nr:porin [Pseudomonas sp.]
MKKKLIAMVVSAAAAIPAVAMADVTVYGRAHVSADMLDDGKDYSEFNISSNSSRLGFKGNHEINPDLKAFFQIEQEVLFGSKVGSTLNTRDTFVGLSGNFGAVQAGRFDSPFKVARGPANLFGDQVGDMKNLARVEKAKFDERYENTIQYTTPTFSGFNAKLGYSVHEGASAASDHKSDSVSLSLNYGAGPLEAAVAYEQVGEDVGERDGIRLAAAYKLTNALKLVGFYQTVEYSGDATAADNDISSSDVYGLGGELKVAANTAVKAMWMARSAEADNRDSDMLAVGIEHKLDKAVRVYANYAMLNNDKLTKQTPWKEGRSAAPGGTLDETASGFSVGLRYDF